jgi:ribosomal protein L16 Arg81 hydroxylase
VNDAPSTLSQDYWNFNDDDDGENSTDNLCAVNKHRARKTNVFEKLNPVFKSLVASIESTEATMEDIEEAFQDILKIEEKFKNRFSRKSRNTSSSSAFVSSNLPDNPRRKTHGTKHLC